MKSLIEVFNDSIKVKILLNIAYKDKVSEKLIYEEEKINNKDIEMTLDFLISNNFLFKENGFFKLTDKGKKLSYTLKEFEGSKSFLKEIRDIDISPEYKVLDIGCGGGAILKEFENININTYGIDKNNFYLKVASLKSKSKLIKSDAQLLPFRQKSFDIVICFLVFPYLNNESKTLSEISRVINEEGYLLLKTHRYWFYLNNILMRKNFTFKKRIESIIVILNTIYYLIFGKKIIFKGNVIESFQIGKNIRRELYKKNFKIIKSKISKNKNFLLIIAKKF